MSLTCVRAASAALRSARELLEQPWRTATRLSISKEERSELRLFDLFTIFQESLWAPRLARERVDASQRQHGCKRVIGVSVCAEMGVREDR